jgi:hypothetical protein
MAAMVEREELGPGSFKLRTPRGEATWIPHSARVIEAKYSGYADLELVEPIMREMAALIERTDGVHCFSDIREIEGYQPELWAKAQEWIGRYRSRMAGSYILQRSPVVEMGVKMLNLFSTNALYAFTKPADFQRKLRECLRADEGGKAGA